MNGESCAAHNAVAYATHRGTDVRKHDDVLARMFSRGTTTKTAPVTVEEPSWVEDRVQRADRSNRVSAAAEVIAQIFEDPDLSPNLVCWQIDDDGLTATEWRNAAKRAGRLLHREVTVFRSRGRQTAVLIQNEEEQAAERERLGWVMDAVYNGRPAPPPLPRNYR